ncbi:MAG: 50S ribosomal protein L2 [Thermoplasmata archaeon]|nr:50S ribosomal protein L2 [Thermoplasmata archaeon]
MGKRIYSQRKGRGGPTFRAPSHRYRADARLPPIREGVGVVEEIVHDPGRTAPLAVVRFESLKAYIPAHYGMYVGQKVLVGEAVEVRPGSIMPLASIPEGVPIYFIEGVPGDGGRYVRTAGAYATVISHGREVVVQMPSGQFRSFHPRCRAVIGIVAGGGRSDRPFLKAGKKVHALRSRARKAYRTRGVAMNPVDHPHGGGSHQHVGRPSTVSKNAPPGRKVGRIAPKKKRRKR